MEFFPPYFTEIHLFFNSSLIYKPKQGSVKLFTMRVERELNMRRESP